MTEPRSEGRVNTETFEGDKRLLLVRSYDPVLAQSWCENKVPSATICDKRRLIQEAAEAIAESLQPEYQVTGQPEEGLPAEMETTTWMNEKEVHDAWLRSIDQAIQTCHATIVLLPAVFLSVGQADLLARLQTALQSGYQIEVVSLVSPGINAKGKLEKHWKSHVGYDPLRKPPTLAGIPFSTRVETFQSNSGWTEILRRVRTALWFQ